MLVSLNFRTVPRLWQYLTSTDLESHKFRRDLATLQSFELVNHNQTGIVDYSTDTPANVIFAANTSAILTPEITNGPYYVNGESSAKMSRKGKQAWISISKFDILM